MNPVEAFFNNIFGGVANYPAPMRQYREAPAPHFVYNRAEGEKSHDRSGAGGGSYLVCVRICDGSFFPVSTAGVSRWDMAQQVCRLLCPNAEMAVYSFPEGGTIEEGASLTGRPYSELPNAGKFEQSNSSDCSCRRPHQSWADALAAAEARYGHSPHDILVTLQTSERLSRPVADPKAKVRSASVAAAEVPGAAFPAAPEQGSLDVNGVDTKLKAATEALSHEASGIKDEETKSGAHFGLNQGRIVEDANADGRPIKVRILTPSF